MYVIIKHKVFGRNYGKDFSDESVLLAECDDIEAAMVVKKAYISKYTEVKILREEHHVDEFFVEEV